MTIRNDSGQGKTGVRESQVVIEFIEELTHFRSKFGVGKDAAYESLFFDTSCVTNNTFSSSESPHHDSGSVYKLFGSRSQSDDA